MISKFLNILKNNKLYFLINEYRYRSIIQSLQNKNKVNIVFLINHISQWKYHSLFNIYKNNKRYSVKVIFVPVDNSGTNYLNDYSFNKSEFQKIGVNLISSYNINKKIWKNINKTFLPDIIFFSRSLTKSKLRYKIFDFNNSLNVYVPYSLFTDNNDKLQCATLFHKLLWKQFLPYKLNLNIAKKFYDSKNVVITDYPGCDVFKLKTFSYKYWKKKIIKKLYGPHITPLNIHQKKIISQHFFFFINT